VTLFVPPVLNFPVKHGNGVHDATEPVPMTTPAETILHMTLPGGPATPDYGTLLKFVQNCAAKSG
jgi:hypothetical protein